MRFMAMPIEFARLTCRTLSLEYNFANVTCEIALKLLKGVILKQSHEVIKELRNQIGR